MKLLSAKIAHFGTIAGPVELRFDEGLNVIYGPNESGKSTFMRAIWYALTRRSSSDAGDIRAIRPYSGETPEVTVEFAAQGAIYRLTKEFKASTGKTHLHIRSQSGDVDELVDKAADRRIREVLGWGEATARTQVPTHYGLWPLIWVWQGEDQRDPGRLLEKRGSDAKLSETLGTLTGQVLTGAADEALYERIEQEYERYYTSSGSETSRKGAPLHQARQARREAEAHLEALRADEERYRGDLASFRRLERERERLENEELPALQQRKEDALRKLDTVNKLEGQKETAQARLEAARGKVEGVERIQSARAELEDELDGLEEAVEEASRQVDEKKRVVDSEREKRPGLDELRDAAGARLDEAKRRVNRLQAWLDHLEEARRTEELEAKVESTQSHHAELVEKRGELADIRVDEKSLARLDRLRRDFEQKRAALEVAAAHVEVRALEDVEVTVGGKAEALGSGEDLERTVDAPLSLRIEDLVEIEVTPGGEHLVDAREAFEKAQKALEEALEELGVEDYDEARGLSRTRLQLEADCQGLARDIERLAPDGETDLESELAAAKRRLESARADYDRLTLDDDSELGGERDLCREQLRQAHAELERAEDAFKQTSDDLNAHDRQFEGLRRDLKHAEERLGELESSREKKRQKLTGDIEQHGDKAALEEALDDERAEVARLEEQVSDYEAQLEAIQAGEVQEQVDQRTEAVEAAREQLRQTSQRLAGLKATLGSAQLHGLHERIETAEHRLEQAASEEARRERDAEAARLLYETVEKARTRTRKQYLEPLRAEVSTLLERLFAGGRVEFGDDFHIAKLSRHSADEFDSLSFGAREQVGLLVRIAAARLLARQGERMPLFLDDILSSTDPHRFERMASVLRHAAKDLQIIITTCHGARFLKLGQTVRHDLEGLKTIEAPAAQLVGES